MPKRQIAQKNKLPATTNSEHSLLETSRIDVQVHYCPTVNTESNLYNFDFAFAEYCPITTCQYHTDASKRKCMILDTSMPSGNITDNQLFYYKLKSNPQLEEKPKLSAVNFLRKKAVNAIKANVVFYYYAEYVQKNWCPEDTNYIHRPGFSPVIDKLLSGFPFTQETIDVFDPWMLPLLFDTKVWEEFLQNNTHSLKFQFSDINLVNVLNLTPAKYKKLKLIVSKLNQLEY